MSRLKSAKIDVSVLGVTGLDHGDYVRIQACKHSISVSVLPFQYSVLVKVLRVSVPCSIQGKSRVVKPDQIKREDPFISNAKTRLFRVLARNEKRSG